jgi:hypothetical protein
MTTDFRALCAELTATLAERIDDKGDAGSYYIHAAHLLARARAALADEPTVPSALVDTHYEWELEDVKGEWQAGGSSNSQSDVEREGMRYLQTYAQDGPHKLIIRQHTTQTINEITNG